MTEFRRIRGYMLAALAVTVFAFTGFDAQPAKADRADKEPSATTTFGKSNRKIRTSNPVYGSVNAALQGHYSKAFALADRSGNPTSKKLVEWIFLRKKPKQAGYTRLMNFVAANPHWPNKSTFLRYAEGRLLYDNAPPATVMAHFKSRKAQSSEGHAALARAFLRRGDKKSARKHVLRAWNNPKLHSATMNLILRDMRGVLKSSDHERRLWILVHAQQTNPAIATARLVSRRHVAAAKAAQLLIRRKGSALKAYRRLPSSMRNKLAMRYALARYYRKKDQPGKALAMLHATSAKTSGIYDQEAWWVERRLIIRRLLGRAHSKQWSKLYAQATRHGFKSGKHFEEGEFLAGWIALRKLKSPKKALPHLKRLAAKGKSRTQRSRGAYWTARAYLALGDQKNTDKYYRQAAQTPTLFYAQLAREALGKGRTPIRVGTGRHDAATKQQVAGFELLRAVRILKKSGGDRTLGSFVWPIARQMKTPAQASAAADLLSDAGGPHLSVRFAKATGRYGIDIDNWGYPVRAMPPIKRIGNPVETAMIFALSRQESEFNRTARSYVGARGLM